MKILTAKWGQSCPLTFTQLFNSCRDRIYYASLTDHSEWYETTSDPIYLNFIEQMAPFLVEEIKTKQWYAYYLGEKSNPGYLTVRIYRYCSEAEKILASLEGVSNIYFGNENHELMTSYPMDLCCFREDESILFGSVSHEKLATMFLYEDEMIENEVLKWFPVKNGMEPFRISEMKTMKSKSTY